MQYFLKLIVYTSMTDQALIRRALRGDETAFNKLYERYDRKLASFVYARVNNPDEAEDVLATIWEKIITHLRDFQGDFEKSFQAWLFTVARNTLINYYKRYEHRSPVLNLDTLKEQLPASEVKDDVSWSERISMYVKSLPRHQSEILRLKYFDDLRNKEIAQKLNLSEKTVAAHLSRALRSLSKRCSNFEL